MRSQTNHVRIKVHQSMNQEHLIVLNWHRAQQHNPE